VRVVCTRVRARVEPGATTGAREYTGSSSLTFPAPAHNHAELSRGNRHSAHRGAKRADVLGVTHRLPPLALDLRHRRSLGLGPKAVASQRGRPHSARRRGVARVKKKGQNYIFFLHIAKERRPVAGVGGTKIFWGRGEKRTKSHDKIIIFFLHIGTGGPIKSDRRLGSGPAGQPVAGTGCRSATTGSRYR